MATSSRIESLVHRRAVILRAIRAIPLGEDLFAELRAGRFVLVDKSNFVSRHVRSPGRCDVFLRPRRFGKSLNASMLHCFLSNQIDPDTQSKMFHGLSVMNDKEFCDEHMGKYAVVHLNLHDCRGATWAQLRNQIALAFKKTLECHVNEAIDEVLSKATVQDGGLIDRVRSLSDHDLSESLLTLSESLAKLHKTQVYIIVDEYDTPLSYKMESKEDDTYRALFFSIFYAAVRHADYVKKACFMGITDIRAEHAFLHHLDIFNVHGIMDDAYGDCFGFTKAEVISVLIRLGLSPAAAEGEWNRDGGIPSWYNGYQMGTRKIINPWSFFKYLCQGLEPGSYWTDSSGGISLLSKIFANPSLQTMLIPALQYLLDNSTESVCSTVHVRGAFRARVNPLERESVDRDAVLDSLCCQGYLTTDKLPGKKNIRRVWIPNNELRDEWMDILRTLSGFSHIEAVVEHYSEVIYAFESFDLSSIGKILKKAFSHLSSRISHKEHVYHLFTAGMMSVLDRANLCKVLTETGAGEGFADLLISFEQSKKTVIIEFKRATLSTASRMAREGILQVYRRNYLANVPSDHAILTIGCAVTRDIHIEMESLILNQGESRNCEEIMTRLQTRSSNTTSRNPKKRRIG